MDIRVLTTFPTHRKIRRLIKTLGHEAVYSLISLWAYTAENHPKGNLVGYDAFEVEEAANWTGECEKLVDVLLDEKTCFLLKIKGGFALRNWEKHQGWIVNAPARREKARLAAAKRWDATSNATGNATSNAKNTVEQCPSPSPIPSPKPKPINKYTDDFESFWNEYPRNTDKAKAYKKYQAIIKQGASVINIQIAANNYAIDCANKKTETRYIKVATTFLNESWKEWVHVRIQEQQPKLINAGASGIPGVEF